MTPTTEEEFRRHVREWLQANATRRRRPTPEEESGAPKALPPEEERVAGAKAFQAALHDAGLAAIAWPTEYGGQGLTHREQRIFDEEAGAFELPILPIMVGLGMCAPTILAHGTDAQKRRYLRPLLRGEEVWCQLFSEPGAGSDLASIQAKAVRDPAGDWVLNGQKVWTSGAHYADFGIVIARTDADRPKHEGISMFIVDMRVPGVTVRPLRQITGDADFDEVFFDDARIASDHLVGEENAGWRAAITTLMNERLAIGTGARVSGFKTVAKLARRLDRHEDPLVRQQLVDLFIRERLLRFTGVRLRQAAKAGRDPGPTGSIAKVLGARLARLTADVGASVAGPAAVAWATDDPAGPRWALRLLGAPATAIGGGTNEIQLNIIGERVLGLAKEPQVDRDVPFKDLKVGTQRT